MLESFEENVAVWLPVNRLTKLLGRLAVVGQGRSEETAGYYGAQMRASGGLSWVLTVEVQEVIVNIFQNYAFYKE